MDDNPDIKIIGSPEELMATIFGALTGSGEPDPMTTAPTITGPKGRAWRVDLKALREREATRGVTLAPDTAVCAWLVEAVEAHPGRHSYLVHAHDLSSTTPDRIWVEGATHELQVHDLIPLGSRDAMLVGDALFPLNSVRDPIFAAQIQWGDHRRAATMIEEVVVAILNGDLVPSADEAHVAAWVARYGDAGFNPEWKDAERIRKATGVYLTALKGLEAATAYGATKDPRLVDPSYMRAGIDSVKIGLEALIKVLFEKGVVAKAEYAEALRDEARDLYDVYAKRFGLLPIPCGED